MAEMNSINTFFNIVYNNTTAFVRSIKDEEELDGLIQFLKERHIDNTYIHNIDKNAINLLSNCKTIEAVEAVIHLPISKDVLAISSHYASRTHVVLIHYENDGYHFYNEDIHQYSLFDLPLNHSITLFDPFIAGFKALLHADELPGMLIFTEKQTLFVKVENQEAIDEVYKHIENQDNLFDHYQVDDSDDLYFVHLSDLHLGKEGNNKGLETLVNSLDTFMPMMNSDSPVHFLITGDLMESPKRSNMYLSRDFMNYLKKHYHSEVTFVLGNHDVIVHGVNFLRKQKSKVIANLLADSIRVLENEKIILIKMDSNIEGNLARGKVGKRQLDEIDDELSAIKNIEEYTIFVLMHHHLYEIKKRDFVKRKLHEKISLLDFIVDRTKTLIDADLLYQWLIKHDIKYVFFGHKHVPDFRYHKNRYFICAGKATGGLKESKSQYISYNVLRYSKKDQKLKTCLVLYYDKKRENRLRIEIHTFNEE